MKGEHRMKPYAALFALGLIALAACEARNPSPALQQAEPDLTIEETALEELDTAGPMDVQGLEMFDADATISVLDTGPQDDLTGLAPPKFALHCDTATKTLEAVAPARQLGPYAVAGPAEFIVSGAVFQGEAVLKDVDGAGVSVTLPLSPELLAAVATAVTARVAIGDGFAESNADTNGAFPGFAGQCSLKSGVPLPPR